MRTSSSLRCEPRPPSVLVKCAGTCASPHHTADEDNCRRCQRRDRLDRSGGSRRASGRIHPHETALHRDHDHSSRDSGSSLNDNDPDTHDAFPFSRRVELRRNLCTNGYASDERAHNNAGDKPAYDHLDSAGRDVRRDFEVEVRSCRLLLQHLLGRCTTRPLSGAGAQTTTYS